MVYTDGNAAPVLKPYPEQEPDRHLSRAERERRARKEHSARRNQQRALAFDRRYMVFLAAATVVLALFCGAYVKGRAELTTNMHQVTRLESEVGELKASNDAFEKTIGASVNLKEVKESAKKYGLSYPGSDQVVYYTIEQQDYMTQLGNGE